MANQPNITRRAVLLGAASSAAVAVPAVAIAGTAFAPVAATPTEPNPRMVGLELAGYHAEQLAAAMDTAEFPPGKWSVHVKSGNAEQGIFFYNDAVPRPAAPVMTPLQRRDYHLAEMLKAAREVDPSILDGRTLISFSDPDESQCAFLVTGERAVTPKIKAAQAEARRREFAAGYRTKPIPGVPDIA